MDGMIRPKATVLPSSALVPKRNLLRLAPNRFTHEVVSEQPYYYRDPDRAAGPDGTFPSGTKVVLMFHDGGSECHVVNDQGLYVVTAFGGLRPIR
jgi:hypothetical protein